MKIIWCNGLPEIHVQLMGGKLDGDSGSKLEGDSGSGSKLEGDSGSKCEGVLLLATRCHAMNTACENIPEMHV